MQSTAVGVNAPLVPPSDSDRWGHELGIYPHGGTLHGPQMWCWLLHDIVKMASDKKYAVAIFTAR